MTKADDEIDAILMLRRGFFICFDFLHAWRFASIRYWFLGSVHVLRRHSGLPQLKNLCSNGFWSSSLCPLSRSYRLRLCRPKELFWSWCRPGGRPYFRCPPKLKVAIDISTLSDERALSVSSLSALLLMSFWSLMPSANKISRLILCRSESSCWCWSSNLGILVAIFQSSWLIFCTTPVKWCISFTPVVAVMYQFGASIVFMRFVIFGLSLCWSSIAIADSRSMRITSPLNALNVDPDASFKNVLKSRRWSIFEFVSLLVALSKRNFSTSHILGYVFTCLGNSDRCTANALWYSVSLKKICQVLAT